MDSTSCISTRPKPPKPVAATLAADADGGPGGCTERRLRWRCSSWRARASKDSMKLCSSNFRLGKMRKNTKRTWKLKISEAADRKNIGKNIGKTHWFGRWVWMGELEWLGKTGWLSSRISKKNMYITCFRGNVQVLDSRCIYRHPMISLQMIWKCILLEFCRPNAFLKPTMRQEWLQWSFTSHCHRVAVHGPSWKLQCGPKMKCPPDALWIGKLSSRKLNGIESNIKWCKFKKGVTQK